jgi:phosphatidylserine/phosphatidylglycerophosphate/cardiolipin synthase-like enzyme
MKSRFLMLLVLVALLLGGLPMIPAEAQQAQPCDARAYTTQLLRDVATADQAVRAADGTNIRTAASSYLQVSQLRQRYEDNRTVPPCALVLHTLITQWFAAGQDKVALLMALAGDPNNATAYRQSITTIDQRMNTLATAANNELTRVQAAGGSSAAQPTPTRPAATAVANVATPVPAAADWYRVYFTNPINSNNPADWRGAPLEQALVFMIDNAITSIDGALFELDAPDTTAALIRAVQRGVRVRLVVDDEHNLDDPTSTINQVIAAGAQVKPDDRSPLMHSKFFIFDSISVWTGATNFTGNGIYNQNNNSILIRSSELAANYQAEFDEMFTDNQFSRTQNGRTTPFPLIRIGSSTIETYFSPEDGRSIETRLTELARASRSSIKVMAFSFTLETVGTAMLERLRAGVRIEGVFETTGSLQGQMRPLACAGANVRQDGNPSLMHHKVFIFDDRTVALGSFNFSNNARDNNTENLLIITDPAIAAAYVQEFQRVFAQGRVPSASDLNCRR